MIPRTFPSTYASNGQQQMVVHFLTSVAGLKRWSDYIPVKLVQGGVENVQSVSLGPILTSEGEPIMVVSVGEDPSICISSLGGASEGDGV
jgi:hypothetical protein